MDFIVEHPSIAGVQLVNLRVYGDERGSFTEIFRREWFPQVDWARTQSNRSLSQAGVLRGLHYHFQQVDYWFILAGKLRAGLADLRPHSPSFGQVATVDLDGNAPQGLFIPVGVAHGFYAQTDCVLMYFVNNYYNGQDEFGVAWDDPQLAVPWGASAPILSGRDAANPRLAAIPSEQLPR